MPFPRRCKHCRCYVAPQLTKCPRCGKTAPSVVTAKHTKEEKNAARAKQDASVPMIHAKNMHWVPSQFAVTMQERELIDMRRQLERASTPAQRNALRSHIRLLKATLARAQNGARASRWTHEIFHGKYNSIAVFISPKQHRYVLAPKDGAADLIVKNRRSTGIEFTRLQRFEKSKFARAVKKEAQQDKTHAKRKKVKQERRKVKRQLTKRNSD